MQIHDLVKSTRTVRRYQEKRAIEESLLRRLVDLARLGGSASNRQPLRYVIVTNPELREQIFDCLGWAGYLTDWPGPEKGERPAAYIICLLDRERNEGPEKYAYFDLGIATQNLLLGAAEKGVYGCRIASFKPKIETLLEIKDRYKVLLVLALGYPAEKVVLEEVGRDGDIRYWRDEYGVHHVPKRRLDDMLLPAAQAVVEE